MKSISGFVSAVLLILLLGPGCSKDDMKSVNCFPTKIGDRVLIYNKSNQVVVDDVVAYYRYDTEGKIISSLGPSGNTLYTYDGAKNLIRSDLPDGSYITYQYSASGQLLSKTNANIYFSKTTTYEYPNTTTRNPSKVTSPGFYNTMDVHEYEYDNKPNPEKIVFPSIQADNNITKHTFTMTVPSYPPPSTSVNSGVVSYTIVYNHYGYPTSIFSASVGLVNISYECK